METEDINNRDEHSRISTDQMDRGFVQKLQEVFLRWKIARKEKKLRKKLILLDEVMFIHTDEKI